MSLLADIVARLEGSEIRCALIGAEALALRGVSRATLDRDLLTTDARVLDAALWNLLGDSGAELEIRRGDAEDPLAGVVRFRAERERPVDLIVGRHDWQMRLLQRAEVLDLGELRIAVPRAADLILLKLYAGGPQDAWDVAQLLGGDDSDAVIAGVEGHLHELPGESRQLWQKILAG